MIRTICFLIFSVFLTVANVYAEELIMARSQQKFPEAMLTLQDSIKTHGYTVARVQRVDVGLTGKGYKTDKYRVVFFGKANEIYHLADKYPELIAFLPPKVSIYAEKDQTMLVTVNPNFFKDMVDEKDGVIFSRWENDIRSVFEEFRTQD